MNFIMVGVENFSKSGMMFILNLGEDVFLLFFYGVIKLYNLMYCFGVGIFKMFYDMFKGMKQFEKCNGFQFCIYQCFSGDVVQFFGDVVLVGLFSFVGFYLLYFFQYVFDVFVFDQVLYKFFLGVYFVVFFVYWFVGDEYFCFDVVKCGGYQDKFIG